MSRKIMLLLACLLFMTSFIIHPVQQAHAEPFYDGTSALEQKKALDYINQLREHMAIGKVTLDPYLVKAAVNHARYADEHYTIQSEGDLSIEQNEKSIIRNLHLQEGQKQLNYLSITAVESSC